MRVFYFTEQPYPDAWDPAASALRVTLPNKLCEPERAADLYERYLDEWQLADELGLHIMVNEHHSTATCLTASATVPLSILARITKQARLLVLGVPLANRSDPLRVAEEMSMIDVISRGRLELGFVKGVPYEIAPADSQPVGMMNRLWESHDLILKAMASHDGPFSWQGDHFHYRSVNIWPRPYQRPHPPIWVPCMSVHSIAPVAARGYVMATFLTGYEGTRNLIEKYREAARENGRPQPGADRFAYLALVAVADTESEAMRRAQSITGYLRTTAIAAPAHSLPPGYVPYQTAAQALRPTPHIGPHSLKTRHGKVIDLATASVQDCIDAGVLFAGTPDQVYQQIRTFDDAVGGIGNLLMMGHAGDLGHADTVDNITRFAKEVLPRLEADTSASQAVA